jgi:type II secretory pathway pseudopilin PulG
LLEVIGVLAVLAILATVIFSATTKSVNSVMSKQERATLQAFANALQNSVLRTRYIPGSNDWYQAVANEMGLSPNAVLYNARNPTMPRLFLSDPTMVLGSNVPALPYTNSAFGCAQLTNARVILISTLGTPLTAAQTNSSNFNALWATPDDALGEDINVQRLNLGPLFSRLQLNNCFSGTNQGLYTVDSSPLAAVGNQGLDAYFIKGSVVQLYETPSLALDVKFVVSGDVGYFYADNVWRDVPYMPINLMTNAAAANLAQMLSASASIFAASPLNINATYTPQGVVGALSNFLFSYSVYAANTNDLNYANAAAAQVTLQSAMIGLTNGIVQGGVLGGCPHP